MSCLVRIYFQLNLCLLLHLLQLTCLIKMQPRALFALYFRYLPSLYSFSDFFYFLTHPSMFLLRSYRSFYVIHPWIYKQCATAYTFVLVLDRQTTTSSGYKQIKLFQLFLDIIETFSKPSWTISYESSVVVFFELLLACKHVLLRH